MLAILHSKHSVASLPLSMEDRFQDTERVLETVGGTWPPVS